MEGVASMSKYINFGEQFSRHIRYINNEYIKSVQSIAEQTSKVVDSYLKTIKTISFDQIQESFKKLAAGLLETEDDLKVFKVAIIDLGYPPHENMDLGTMRGIAKAYVEDKETLEEVIDDIMCEYYDDIFFRELGAIWEDSNGLQRRLSILRNVIMSHNLGMYGVSVPTIIAQLEGMIVEAFEIKGRVNGGIINILLSELLRKEEAVYSFNEEILGYYKDNILAGFEHGKIVESDISRNAILHGADVEYGKQTVSIKAILLFDFIADKLDDVDQGLIRETKNKVEEYRRSLRRK